MTEQEVRAAVEAAVRRCDENIQETKQVAWDQMLGEIITAVRKHATDEYQRGHADGMAAEREVHFG